MGKMTRCDCEAIADFGVRGILAPTDFDDCERSRDGRIYVARHDACAVYDTDHDAAMALARLLGLDPIEDRDQPGRFYFAATEEAVIDAMRAARAAEGIEGVERYYDCKVSWGCTFDAAPTYEAALLMMADNLGALLREAVKENDIALLECLIDGITENEP